MTAMNVGQIRDALRTDVTVSVDADDVLVVTARSGDRLVTLTEREGTISAEAWLVDGRRCDGRTYRTQAGAVRFAQAFLGADVETAKGPRLPA